MFDELFGEIFDFNGDGNTDFAEETIGFAVIEDMMNEEDNDDTIGATLENEWE